MAITYNLNINSLSRKLAVGDLSNVVCEISVSASAQSQEYPQFSYSCGGQIQLDIFGLDESSFIPFEEVTKETVIGWLLEKENVESIEEFSYVKFSIDNVQDRIDALQLEDCISVNWLVTNAPEVVVTETTDDIQENILEP